MKEIRDEIALSLIKLAFKIMSDEGLNDIHTTLLAGLNNKVEQDK